MDLHMKTAIQHLQARRIWDSRGHPTVEVDVRLHDGSVGRGVAPAAGTEPVDGSPDRQPERGATAPGRRPARPGRSRLDL